MSVCSPSTSNISWIGNLGAILNSALRCASPIPPVAYVEPPCLWILGASTSSAAPAKGMANANKKPAATHIFFGFIFSVSSLLPQSPEYHACHTRLLCVGLILRHRLFERLQREAMFIDTPDGWK